MQSDGYSNLRVGIKLSVQCQQSWLVQSGQWSQQPVQNVLVVPYGVS